MNIALNIAALASGVAALIFIYDRFAPIFMKRRKELRRLLISKPGVSQRPSSLATRPPARVRVYPRWVELSLMGYGVSLTIAIALIGAKTDFAVTGFLCMLIGAIPAAFDTPLTRRGYENLSAFLLYAGLFSMFGGYCIGMVGGLAEECFGASSLTAAVSVAALGFPLAVGYSHWVVRV